MKKIILIEPKGSKYNVYSTFKLPRLGLAIIGAILKRAGYDVTIFAESISKIDFEELFKADAVGISTLTCTAPRAYALGDVIRENSSAKVFMGGPHVSFLPEEALNHCDYVLRGEAEDTILPFIKALEANEGFNKIPGLSYKENGRIIHTGNKGLVKDLDSLPSPDLDLYTARIPKNVAPVVTSRGCPYGCTFCSVTKMFGRGYRANSVDRVIADVKDIIEKGYDWIFFYDDNFVANPKRTKAILRKIIDEKIQFKWGAQVRAEIAKDSELLELMKLAGADFLYIGFESINPSTLECFNKNQSVEDIEKSINEIHKYGINIHGMFVIGSDADDSNIIPSTVDFAIKNRIDTIQLMALVPLPGTVVYNQIQKENRILTYDWSKYDAHYVVFKPLKMTPYELQWGIIKGLAKFYSWKEVVKRFSSFDIRNAVLKVYGHYLVKKWRELNTGWLNSIVELSEGIAEKGRLLHESIKETAQDVYAKVEALYKKYGYPLPWQENK
jgi:radical SAM superfamily enzyme YgiQ (UPF0313 family)